MSETERVDHFVGDENLESKVKESKTKISDVQANYAKIQNELRNLKIEQGGENINLEKMYKDAAQIAAKTSIDNKYQKGEITGKIMSYVIENADKIGIPASLMFIQSEINKAEKNASNTQKYVKESEINIQRLEDKLAKTKSMIETCSNASFMNVKMYDGLQDAKTDYFAEINKLKSEEILSSVGNSRQIAYLNREIKKVSNDSLKTLKERNEYKTLFNDLESELNALETTLNQEEGKYNNMTNNLQMLREDINTGKLVHNLISQGKSIQNIYKQIDKNNVSGNSLRQIGKVMGPEIVNIQSTINYRNGVMRESNTDTEWRDELQSLNNQNKLDGKISLDERMMKYVTIN